MENLQRLRVLRAVALEGSFTAAAAALSLSQPSVSQHISALERELGDRLVDRSTTGARLTEAGAIALRHAHAILAIADDARRELAEFRSRARAPIRVAAFPTAAAVLLPRALAGFARLSPGTPCVLIETDAAESVALVRRGEADLALAYDHAADPLDLAGLSARRILDDPLRLVLPDDHPSADLPIVDLAGLRDEPWVSLAGHSCAESLRTLCGAAGFAPRLTVGSGRYATILALVAAGHGIALVPRTALSVPHPGVTVRPLRPDPPPRRIWAATGPRPADTLALLAGSLGADPVLTC
ncbi:LysR family transcriptional regulator [Actinocorallia longicatena]|uniref:LysR family transcriptional regulator n=1 Tax=Actinocorallia longicatena TaxID=111803 RepID=A0ABP6QA69_9ACTN